MQKISLDEISTNERIVLARPVILGTGVKGFNAGVEVNDRVVAMLKKLGFEEIWIAGEDEEVKQIIEGEEGEAEEITQREKFLKIKNEVANVLADIMTEKDPQREILKIKNVSRNTILMKKGALTRVDPERPSWEIKDLKKFSESIITVQRLEEFMKMCRDLLENEFSPRRIDSVSLNLNDTRMEESYIYHHMANCGLYFLATVAKHNAELKKKGAVSSRLKYSKDFRAKKDAVFFFEDDEMLSGALGAFMHDVGYLHDGMPEILAKKEVISKEDHDVLKKHVEVSMNVVSYHTFFSNRPLAISVIENHHERLDGSGYPKGKNNFHAFSRILGVIDVFDSLVNDRPWRKKFARSKVLEYLYQNSEKKSDLSGNIQHNTFDRELFLCFERILNLYEVGETVDLYHVKTTEPVFRARVKENNPGRPENPIVELLHCYADPKRDVAGKVLNLLSINDLYVGETTDFKKGAIT
ncbi:MAG: HD domain-containing phosphohydrolase [bacterium]